MEWVLDLRHPALDPVFRVLSFLGDATFFVVAFALGYWLLSRRVFLRASVVLMIAALVNDLLKAIFQVPRPDAALHLVEAHGWSFPSGHAMMAAAVWPWLARESGRRAAMPAALALAVLIAASRVYNGVHTPADVLVGLALGVLLSLALWPLAEMTPAVWRQIDWRRRAALAAVPVVLLLWALPDSGDDVTAKAGGTLVGLALGADLERRRIGFVEPRRTAARVGAALAGLGLIAVLRIGGAALFDLTDWPARLEIALRYGLVGLALTFGAPWLFVRCGWSAQEPEK